MARPEVWTTGIAWPGTVERAAARAEGAGFDGLAVVDSQNLAGDPWVGLARAARETERLGLGTAVTNPVTRHPAVTAAAAVTLQVASAGRFVLGIGRGDSALAHLGRAPASVATFDRYLAVLQAYLRGDKVEFDDLGFHESVAPSVDTLGLANAPTSSSLHFVPPDLPKVPVEVAATGPRVLATAARHTQFGSPQASTLTPEFIERFGIVGTPETCAQRLGDLVDLGLDKLIVTGPTLGADPAEARAALARFATEVLPAIR